MEKCSFFLILVILLSLSQACKREHQTSDRPVIAGQTPSSCCPNNLGDSTISGVVTSNLFLQRCKTYKLSGLVYVSNNATITIDEGTRIEGLRGVGGNPGGGLIITKGARINAVGSPSCPIVFTSAQTNPVPGDWSGIIILGKATTNVFATTRVEGIPGTPPADITFGGVNDADNSGVMQYVRIEYAGYELSLNNEINGLTLAGVGTGTLIDHVEVYKARDDAFQIFGGTVNLAYLVAIDPLDDMFDIENGYRGTITRSLGVADIARADISVSNGLEIDNDVSGNCAGFPKTKPVVDHMTIVGLPNQTVASTTTGAPSGSGRYGSGAYFGKATQFVVTNSVFMGYNTGMLLDGCCTYCDYKGNLSVLSNNLVQAFTTPFGTIPAALTCTCIPLTPFPTIASVDNSGYTTINPNVNIGLVNPYSSTRAATNYFPASVGDARFFEAGAFDFGGANWAAGWVTF